ncbi:CPSF domain-containing protein [Heterostelium album PN500]|uniref:CPSF domain-containing protein n=1 Tax=Heterostelium pallidum (strain ATCC 26659 / Pp 5 / PN500) TaxID=670386 RepID=D3BN72_HETP5|nr:CPSF domain-containing protein [Heterostelium album PN500]EFA76732.1 CPSF domain-containing protein [Heterostelium album PN500]|eukprot:XP_020428864.1 CPSF domain-containing protein [Heterostelium album PN500]
MYLYNLTIQKPTSIYHSIVGNFSGTKQIEILVSHGRSLELLRPDETNGKITSVLYTEVFGLIRSIAPFRLTSGTKDYIIIGSESGRVVILEYNPNKNRFEKVHQETFGRTGCRRIVPGQYLATDPRGRAFMIGAIEKQKLVYILNRDSAARLTISSPLEAHKSHTILFAMCGVDVGFENPIFATLSVDYSDDTDLEEMEDNHSKMMLTFYELDLGLNNVVRKWSEEVESSSNLLMTVPGGSDGPGVMDLVNEEQPQIYALTGVADRSAMRVLRYGLPIAQIAGTPLPGIPSGLWTIPRSQEDSIDKYIVVSFIGSTLVLSVGETVEEVVDSGILATTTSILVRPIGADSIIQVFPHGIRHIKGDRRINEWRAPGRKTISLATSNATQVVIALGGGEVIYFELDAAGNLSEVAKKEFRREISALEIAPVRKGRQMARFVAIGDWEGPVRVLSLDKDNLLNQVSVLDTERMHIESLMMNEMTIGVEMPEGTASSSSAIAKQQQLQNQSNQVLFLNVGLKNGVMKRAVVDPITGELSDTRTRLLGRKPVKFSRVKLKSGNAVLALSSRVWLCYVNQGRYDMVPVSVEPLDNASGFSSEHCPDGIVATSENNLKIFVIEKLSEKFNQVNVPYKCTPRRFVVHPQTHYIVSIETEHNYLNELPTPKENGSNKMAEDKDPEVKREGDDMDYEVDQFSLNQNDKPPKAGDGKWLSYIRVLEPVSYRTLDLVKLDQDEAAYSLATCIFHDREGEVFLAVGCGKGVQLNPRKVESASIHLYRFTNNGQTLQLVYKTEVEEVPYAISHFQGRLLVGIANQLRIYEMVNHISKTSLSVGGPEVLVYATLNGTIGALVPFVSREDVDFYTSLELQMRQENPPLCGRDHLAYRSYYFPVKNVIDGDLCEQYISLDPTKQQSIAEELSRSPSEILKKLEDLRSSKLY